MWSEVLPSTISRQDTQQERRIQWRWQLWEGLWELWKWTLLFPWYAHNMRVNASRAAPRRTNNYCTIVPCTLYTHTVASGFKQVRTFVISSTFFVRVRRVSAFRWKGQSKLYVKSVALIAWSLSRAVSSAPSDPFKQKFSRRPQVRTNTWHELKL